MTTTSTVMSQKNKTRPHWFGKLLKYKISITTSFYVHISRAIKK